MKITHAEWFRYKIPFRRVFTTSHGEERYREGLILRLQTDEGSTGLGEASPLPAFGTGTVDDSEKHLTCIAREVQGATLEDVDRLIDAMSGDPRAAPVRFALDTALLDIRAQWAGVPLCRYLNENAVAEVPVNATIGDGDIARACSAAVQAVNAGYRTIKLKVGVAGHPGNEIERIAAVRDAIGAEAELRLDANGAWTYEQALDIMKRVDQLDIIYVEQPLHPDNLEGMAELRRNTRVPIAADESATTPSVIDNIIEREAADVIIVKPGVVGGLRASRQLIERAQAAGIRVVVTTALESGIGIAAALHLSAMLTQPILACGLATGGLLESDLLIDSLRISDGRMRVPDRPGLGVAVDQSTYPHFTHEASGQGG